MIRDPAGAQDVGAAETAGFFRAVCSFAQQRLWFLDRLEPGTGVYNLASALRLAGALDLPALARSFREVVRRHEALRTTFAMEDGSPVQVVHQRLEIELGFEDLGTVAEAAPEEELRRRASGAASEPFDLAHGPLVRGRVLRLGESDHVVLLAMHHIVADGWSMGVLIRELSALYEAFSAGRESPLDELTVQYADYAQWQREWLQGDVLAKQVAYWRSRLEGLAPVLWLPTDRQRPPAPTHRGEGWSFALSEETSEGLRQLSRRQGVTLFMTLLAGFQALLGRYAGEVDVAVGSPIAGRTRSELEGLIGCFVNTLVLRTDLSGDPTTRELLRRVLEVTLGAYAHQDVPFEKLVEELQPERSLSHHPLFQVMFVLQNTPAAEPRLTGLSMRLLPEETSVAKFDLLLSMQEAGGPIHGTVEYSAELFAGATVRRLVAHLGVLLEGMAAHPEGRLMDLPLLHPAERQQLLVEWNATGVEELWPESLPELLERQVGQVPDAVAVAFGEARLSYGELERRARRLARRLEGLGVGPEALVGICMERSLEMVVGLLAVLKAGGAYLPLDPEYPRERLAMMLADSGARVVLAQRRLHEALSGWDGRSVWLDDDGEAGAAEEEGNGECGERRAGADNLAYVIYTSGSTGLPKGVEVRHRSLVNFVVDMVRRLGLGRGDRLLSVTSLSFDIFGLELWVPLACGGQVRLASREATLDGALLARTLAEMEATVLQSTPATWRLLLAAGWSGSPQLRLLCGGEALAGELAERLLDKGRELWNLYGPTETTIWSAVHRVELAREPMPIGRPIANTALYVLDGWGQPVPVGVAGELCIGGDGLARGYLGRRELTAERFVPDPFAGRGARLYRTGDLARHLPDGTLEFLGRIDHQVKLRGFRIEPGEIEAVLAAQPGVEQVVVVAREDPPGDPRLVAYVTGREAVMPGIEELRRRLADRLPAHMVPSAFVLLERLPLTPNGKLDRRALPAPGGDRPQLASRYVAPRNAVEELLAGIWAEVLGLARVGIDDGFFELGGHSLLATRAVSRVRDSLGIELPLRAVFERPTPGGLAELVQSLLRSAAGVSSPPLTRMPRADHPPLSYAQQRMWFLEQVEPGSAAYHMPVALRLAGPLDLRALEHSLHQIVRRHEVLRTSFVTAGGTPVQVIAEDAVVPLSVVDLSRVPGSFRDQEVGRWATWEATRPFDLTRAPAMRACVLRLGDDDHALLLTLHHIVSDGWSMMLLLKEASSLYEVFARGGPSRRQAEGDLGRAPAEATALSASLPSLPIQYADYAQWQRQWLSGELLQVQLSYWREQLRGLAPLLNLPTDRQRPAVQTYRGAAAAFRVPEVVAGPLLALSRREGVTLYMTLLAVLQALLSRYTGEDDVAVGSPIAGRTRRELEGLIGVFVNTLVMRTDLSGNPTARQLLGRVRDAALGAYAHQDVPFERVVEALRPERSLAHDPLFQVMFVLQNLPSEALRLPQLKVRPLAGDDSTVKFDLVVSIHESAEGLDGTFQYRTDLFERVTIRRMAGHFERLLEAVVEDPGARPLELPLLSAVERWGVLVEWNDTLDACPSPCIHELFDDEARRRPEAVALACEGAFLSYGELDRRANRLAHHLRRLGVGPEVRVGICLERSLELVVGLLGILKAGGAYLPLDPAFPRERVRYTLEDSGAVVLLTQEDLREAMPATAATVVCLDRDWAAIACEPEEAPRDAAAPGNLAYVIYTSGSTGTPKGVAIEHRQLRSYGEGIARRLGVAVGESYALVQSVAADTAATFLYLSLTRGGCLHLLGREAVADAAGLGRYFEERWIDYLKCVPSHLAALRRAERGGRIMPRRTLIVGGEAAVREWVEELRAAIPATTALVNHYGPTETTVGVLTHRFGGEDMPARVPLGRPLSQTQAYVLDAGLRPVPIGVAGELCIGGRLLARGYLGRPRQTAERFVPHPFGEGGERLYRTGDLSRQRADGEVEYLGRIDRQVKVRGFRIELGEIEALLCRHPGVGQAVALVREDAPGERRLVAYVVGRDGSAPGAAELRSHLAAQLPEPMVPASYVALASLPLLPNGKLDHRSLPEPETQVVGRGDGGAPQTAVERVLAGIWEAVLGREGVGVEESFFELGGDSILSIQVIAQAREAGYQLTLRQVFQQPTIAGLARVAVAVGGRAASQDAVTGAVALTPIQRWFFGRELEQPYHYNQAVLLALREPADVAALAQAVRALVRHHDALRLRFERQREGWRQWHAGVGEESEAAGAGLAGGAGDAGVFSQMDLSGVAAEERRDALVADASRVQASLDLTAGPLLRVVHYGLGEGGERLLVVVHHLAVDGVSWRILLADLVRAYEQLLAGRPVELPAKTTSFQEWARRLGEHAHSEAMAAEADHWLAAERGEVARLPVDHLEGGSPVESWRVLSVALSAEETRALLQEVPAVYRTRIDEVLLAALAQAVSSWTGRSRVVVDLEGHGREELFSGVDLSRTVGWFTSLYPVVLELGGCSGPGESLEAVKEQLRAVPRRGIGYGLLRYLGPEAVRERLAALPGAEIRFNYLGQLDQVLGESGVFAAAPESAGESQGKEGKRPYLLDINGLVGEGRLQLDWTYGEAVHRRETVAALADSFLRSLRAIIDHCREPEAGGCTPSDFPLAGLDQAALQRVAALLAGNSAIKPPRTTA